MLLLNKIGENARRAFIETGAFVVGRAELTPDTPCCQGPNHRCVSSPATWSTSTVWTLLDFQIDEPALFRYSYDSDGRTFRATAVGDLDCDGETITFTAQGENVNGEPVVTLTEEPRPGTH